MASYGYLMSSLPLFFLDTEDVPTMESFLDACLSSLTPADMELLERFSKEPTQETLNVCTNPDLKKYLYFDIGLKNELARARAQKLGFEADKYTFKDEISGDDFTTSQLHIGEIARAAVSNANPLSAEIFLLEERWAMLDEIEVGKFFDIVKVIVYYLKLQIVLKRKNLQDLEKGRKEYQEIYMKTAKEFNS